MGVYVHVSYEWLRQKQDRYGRSCLRGGIENRVYNCESIANIYEDPKLGGVGTGFGFKWGGRHFVWGVRGPFLVVPSGQGALQHLGKQSIP